jgi:hypothetical protein
MSPLSIGRQQAANGDAKRPISWKNLLIGAGVQVFEVSTLGQPFEVLKTHMAAHRGDSLRTAVSRTWARGGLGGFYQGLLPWAWIEASTKGGILLWSSSELEYRARQRLNCGPSLAGVLGGMGGGICQAYTTMGFCTFMKTVEVTRHKLPGQRHPGTLQIACDVLRTDGLRGLNRGVTAVALRQMTNWGSRFGISRLTEQLIQGMKSGDGQKRMQLTIPERLAASVIGGMLACWNQPIEVIRVEMQSQVKTPGRPANLTLMSAARYIYGRDGVRGFYRGVTPRIALGIWLTVCMVFGGDQLKAHFGAAPDAVK